MSTTTKGEEAPPVDKSNKKPNMVDSSKQLPPTPTHSPCPLPSRYTEPATAGIAASNAVHTRTATGPREAPYQIDTSDEGMNIRILQENSIRREPLLPPILTSTRPQSQLPLNSSPNFDFITKLPTPIVGTAGSTFGAFQASPPRYGNEELDIRKRSQQPHHSQRQYTQVPGQAPFKPSRVISEYRPSLVADTSAYKLQQVIGNLKTPTGEPITGKRFISNPYANELLKGDALKGEVKSSESGAEVKQQGYDLEKNSTSSLPTDPIYSGFLHPQNLYSYVRQIGTGLFSKVILAENIDSREPIAIKIIEVPHRNKDELKNFKSFIERELKILFQLNHPNIISLIDYNVNLKLDLNANKDEEEIDVSANGNLDGGEISDEEFASVTDLNNKQLMLLKYCKGGNLFEFVLKNYADNYTEVQFWRALEKIVMELLEAVGYLHLRNVIHRDIKLENILLNYEGKELLDRDANFKDTLICLADFGLSKKVSLPDELLVTRCGSEDYISPELLMGLSYNGQLTDAWSIGVVVYALLENRLPFDLPPIGASKAAAATGNATSGVSPSVLKRQRNKNRTPHRIAMIDWGWFKALDLLDDQKLDEESKAIIKRLQSLVEVLLIRKQNRMKVLDILSSEDFAWVSNSNKEKHRM